MECSGEGEDLNFHLMIATVARNGRSMKSIKSSLGLELALWAWAGIAMLGCTETD